MNTVQTTAENLLRFCENQKYATIYADPPWRFQNRTGKVAPEHKRLNRYETMPNFSLISRVGYFMEFTVCTFPFGKQFTSSVE